MIVAPGIVQVVVTKYRGGYKVNAMTVSETTVSLYFDSIGESTRTIFELVSQLKIASEQ